MNQGGIVLLKRNALSSNEDAVLYISLLLKAVQSKPSLFPHLGEVASYWLARRTEGKILVADATNLLDPQGACLDALATYAAIQPRRAPGILQNLSDLLPTLMPFASQLLSEFSAEMDELTMPEYISPFLQAISFILTQLSSLDRDAIMYPRFMTPTFFALAFKSWIKIFAHLEFYDTAPESIYSLLLPKFEGGEVESGEAYAPILSAIPFPMVVKCIHNITPLLRNTAPRSDSLAPPLMFLTATSIPETPFRCVLFRHGALSSILVLLRRLVRTRSVLDKEQQFIPSCLTFLQFAAAESEHWLYELLRVGFLEALIRCHDPANTVATFTSIVSELINTVTVHCTNPDVFRRVQRTIRTLDVTLADLPLEIQRSWGGLQDTLRRLAPFMALGVWRQCRVCSYPQCQKGSCKYCCTRCRRDFYCSTGCQKADFARHRRECQEMAELYRMGARIPTNEDNSWRDDYYDRLVRYLVFYESGESKKIKEMRVSYARVHSLPLREVGITLDLASPTRDTTAFRVTEDVVGGPVSGISPRGLCMVVNVPFPSRRSAGQSVMIFSEPGYAM